MAEFVGLTAPGQVALTWFVARGTGFVVYGLLTLGVCMGLLLSLKWRTDLWPRVMTEELHRFVFLVAGIVLCLHIASVVTDPFIRFGLADALVPGVAAYRTVWLSCGIVAMYLGVALALSTLLRRWIGYRTWRSLHYAGFASWLLASAHGIAVGTDTRTAWATVVYLCCVGAVALLLCVRFAGVPLPVGKPPRLRPRLLAALVLALVGAYVGARIGPWSGGWYHSGHVPVVTPLPGPGLHSAAGL